MFLIATTIVEPLPPLAINIHVTVDEVHGSEVIGHFNLYKGKGVQSTQQVINMHLANVNPQTIAKHGVHYYVRGWICKMTLPKLDITTKQLIPQRNFYDEPSPNASTTTTLDKAKKRKVMVFDK